MIGGAKGEMVDQSVQFAQFTIAHDNRIMDGAIAKSASGTIIKSNEILPCGKSVRMFFIE